MRFSARLVAAGWIHTHLWKNGSRPRPLPPLFALGKGRKGGGSVRTVHPMHASEPMHDAAFWLKRVQHGREKVSVARARQQAAMLLAIALDHEDVVRVCLSSHCLNCDPFPYLSTTSTRPSTTQTFAPPPPPLEGGSCHPDNAGSTAGDEELPFHLAGYAPLGNQTPARVKDGNYAACSTPQSINVDALKRPGVSGVRAMFEGGNKQDVEGEGKKEGRKPVEESLPMSLKERMAALEKGQKGENEVRPQMQPSSSPPPPPPTAASTFNIFPRPSLSPFPRSGRRQKCVPP